MTTEIIITIALASHRTCNYTPPKTPISPPYRTTPTETFACRKAGATKVTNPKAYRTAKP